MECGGRDGAAPERLLCQGMVSHPNPHPHPNTLTLTLTPSPTPTSTLALTPTLTLTRVAALDGGTAGFVEGWFVPPITGDASFLLPKDAQAWLSWSATAAATALTPLAAVLSPSASASVGGGPWPTWPADGVVTGGASSSNLGATSTKLSLVKGRSYWLSLNCSAATTAAQGCALGVRLHAALAPHGLSLAGRTLTGRTEVTSCLALADRDACCAAFERVALATGFVNQARSGYPCIPAVASYYPSAVCLPSTTSSLTYPRQQAACPPRPDAVGLARPRLHLPSQIPCSSLTDRYKCANGLEPNPNPNPNPVP